MVQRRLQALQWRIPSSCGLRSGSAGSPAAWDPALSASPRHRMAIWLCAMLLPFAAAAEPEVKVHVAPYGEGIVEPEAKAEPAPAAPLKLETLQAVFRLNSLVDWVQARAKLRKAPPIKEFRELEVTTGFVKLELDYTGSPETLAAALQKEGLSLVQKDQEWLL